MKKDSIISELYNEIFKEATKIGYKPPFTAERFLVALIRKIMFTSWKKKSDELNQTEVLLQDYISDLSNAKSVLLGYIYDNKNPSADSTYIHNRIEDATKILKKDNVYYISAYTLLESIIKEPSDIIKSVLSVDNNAKEVKYKPKGEDTSNSISINKENKKNMKTLISDVKNIRNRLSGSIFGQNNAINSFVTGYFQSNLLTTMDKFRKRPKATFLFAGPPGVGKTYMAENVAEILGLPFLRVDMSEYAAHESNLAFCGSNKVYKESQPGIVTSFVSSNPKCVLLFDEIEKANIDVIHLFLQMLDAGRLRDNYTDKEVLFSETIIIITTNAGRQLYEDDTSIDYSSISRKIIIDALQKDINPKTGEPFFPSAICSRFASGNVIMFNHISASALIKIAKNEIERQINILENEIGININVEDNVYTALLFAEGASADARTIRGRAESFFNNELYELLRLVDSEKVNTEITDINNIHISLDYSRATDEVLSLFENNNTTKVLMLADESMIETCKKNMPNFSVKGACETETAVEILKSNDIDFVMINMRCGVAETESDILNIEDVDSEGRNFYRYICEYKKDIPIYLIEDSEYIMTEEERISFLRQGVRDILAISKGKETFEESINDISTSLYQQACMTKLAKENKLVSFETAQFISENGNDAEISLFDLKLDVAVKSEDKKNMVSSILVPDIKFDDIIGAEDAKRELKYFVDYLKNPKKYADTGVKAPKGVLLYGPPGTGKTMLAKAMAKETNVTFLVAEGNQFLRSRVGEGADMVHKIFKTARRYAPAILFIDEIDAIAKERSSSTYGGNGDILTAFLTEMDGFVYDATKPVFVLAATNFDVKPGVANSLDQALMRRFDRRVYIELPGKEDRIKYINMKIEKNHTFDISEKLIDILAMRSTGMSLAEIDSMMELALRSAIRENSNKVTDAILEEAFETFNNGDAKKWEQSQLERVARHEAGHAFMCWYNGGTPTYLTIVARGNEGGYMQQSDDEDKAVYTKEEILSKIKTSLAGRAAEIAYYGDKDGSSTGAAVDLISATNLARQILCSYGMDSKFGLAVITDNEASSGTLQIEIREAVNTMLKEQMEETVKIIMNNKAKIDLLVEKLMIKNHLNAFEIEEIFGDGKTDPKEILM